MIKKELIAVLNQALDKISAMQVDMLVTRKDKEHLVELAAKIYNFAGEMHSRSRHSKKLAHVHDIKNENMNEEKVLQLFEALAADVKALQSDKSALLEAVQGLKAIASTRELPDEILLEIFKNLSEPDRLIASFVCVQWHSVYRDNSLWREHILEEHNYLNREDLQLLLAPDQSMFELSADLSSGDGCYMFFSKGDHDDALNSVTDNIELMLDEGEAPCFSTYQDLSAYAAFQSTNGGVFSVEFNAPKEKITELRKKSNLPELLHAVRYIDQQGVMFDSKKSHFIAVDTKPASKL